MVSQLIKHERIETTVAKVGFFYSTFTGFLWGLYTHMVYWQEIFNFDCYFVDLRWKSFGFFFIFI